MKESEHIPEYTDINETLLPITSEKPFSCMTCDSKYITETELKFHEKVHLSKSVRKCKYCTYFTLDIEFLKHCDTHVSENTHECGMCEYKTKIQYEMLNHVMHVHGIENDDTTNENLSTLCGAQPQEKLQIETNNKVITPDCAGAKEKTYVCPSCDYSCFSNAGMKTHMQTHNILEIYMICDEEHCNF